MKSEEKKSVIDLDKIIEEIGFGPYQLFNFILIIIPIMFSAIYNAQYIFAASSVDLRCKVPECELNPPSFETAWPWAYPSDGRCMMFEYNGTGCSQDNFINNTVSCESWVYRDDNSIVSEFNLGCNEFRRTMVGTIHSLGMFPALLFTGYVSDTYGRKIALIATGVMAGICGVLRAFSTSYMMYVALEFFESMLGSGVYSTGFLLAVEILGARRRVLGGNVIATSFASGQALLALVAWLLPNWKTLTLVLYAPSLLIIVYYFYLGESTRWLLTKGRKKEAVELIYKAASINKKKLSADTIKSLEYESPVEIKQDTISISDEKLPQVSVFKQVIRSTTLLMRMAICSFWWITVTLVYYGLSINSVNLDGNMYANYALTALVEIPGYCLSVYSLDVFGRKKSIMTSLVICGVTLLALAFLPAGILWLITCLNLLGKLCISMVFSSIYIYTAELFPTVARHRLLATCSMIGRIGSTLAPLTPLLSAYYESLPYILFGGMAAASALLMTMTPETLHTKLPDTVEEAESVRTKTDRQQE